MVSTDIGLFFGRSEPKEVTNSFNEWLVQISVCFFGRCEPKEVRDRPTTSLNAYRFLGIGTVMFQG